MPTAARRARVSIVGVTADVLSGEPADWTDVSTRARGRSGPYPLLAPAPAISARFASSGERRRAPRTSTRVTRKRVPSPLVPAAYAEGCPDLSPDGKRLVYQGHTADGRAFAFLSQRPDGRDAVPVVPTAEPSMSSEPTWLGDGETFSFDVDPKHMGVFSTATGRMKVLPEVTAKPYLTSFRFVNANRDLRLDRLRDRRGGGFRHLDPRHDSRTEVPAASRGLRPSTRRISPVLRESPPRTIRGTRGSERRDAWGARAGYACDGRRSGTPLFLSTGLAFVGLRFGTSVVVDGPDGAAHRWRPTTISTQRRVVVRTWSWLRRCADRMAIERRATDGRLIAALTPGPWDTDPNCSPDGKILSICGRRTTRASFVATRRVVDASSIAKAMSLVISPDGKRLAIVRQPEEEGADRRDRRRRRRSTFAS